MAESSIVGSEVSPNFVYDEESKTLTVRHIDTLHVGNVDKVHVGDIHHHVSEEDCDESTRYQEMEVDTNIEPINEPVTIGTDEAGDMRADPRILQRLQKVLSNVHNPGKWEKNRQMCLELVSLFEHQSHACLTKVRFESDFFVRVKEGPDHDAFLRACRDGTLSRGLTKLLVTPELEEEVGVKLGVRLDVKEASNTNNVSAPADGLTGPEFPQKEEAAQAPSGGQTISLEPKATIEQPLLDNKSSKYHGDVARGGMDQHSEEESHHSTADLDGTCEYISSDGKKVHWEFLTDSPYELKLQDNEVGISCGIKFSPSGAKLSEPMKVTLDHNAHFNNPRRAEIVFYTRNKDSKTFVRIPASADGYPRCDVRSKDLDLYVDHFSIWWIVALITRYFVGKRVNCTPYVLPPVTKGITHLVILCIYHDLLHVIKKTNEEMKEYTKLSSSQEMLVEWRCGDINIKLFDGPKENEEKIDEMRLGEREMNLLERKQFSFDVKPVKSGAIQKLLKFTLDQKDSPSYPTLIRFKLSYDEVATATAVGAAFFPIHGSSQTTGVSTLAREVTDEEIARLSNLLPGGKYSELFSSLKFDYNYRQKIKAKHCGDSTAAIEELLQEWKNKGGSMEDLDAALRKADLEGIVHKYKN